MKFLIAIYNVYEYVQMIIFGVLTDSDQSIWMIRSDKLFEPQSRLSKVHIFHQLCRSSAVVVLVMQHEEAISAAFTPHKIQPLRVSTKRRRNLITLRDITRKK